MSLNGGAQRSQLGFRVTRACRWSGLTMASCLSVLRVTNDSLVARPTKKTDYTIRFASVGARKGWRELDATIRNPTAKVRDFPTRTPTERIPSNYSLRSSSTGGVCSSSRCMSTIRTRRGGRKSGASRSPERPQFCDQRYSIYGSWNVVRPGRIRTCPGPRGQLSVAPAHLLGMDATTQITATLLTQHEVAGLLRLPERTL